MSKSLPPPSNLDVTVYFWPKQISPIFSQISIAIVNWNQNSILYIERTCNITRLIHITWTIFLAIATDCWGPRQENVLPNSTFLFNEDSENVENTCNLRDWEKDERCLTFFKLARLSFKQNEDCDRHNRHWNLNERTWRN